MNDDMVFSEDWFSKNASVIDFLIEKIEPKRILEIGCFEGRSATHFLKTLNNVKDAELVCIDPWLDYGELQDKDFVSVEKRFLRNMAIAKKHYPSPKLTIMKGKSVDVMAELIANQTPQFDVVYIDGAHFAVDVFLDAAMGFHLLKSGGLIIFDDYLDIDQPLGFNKYEHPKVAIDAFIYAHMNLVESIRLNVVIEGRPQIINSAKDAYQCYLRKK